MSTEDDDFVQVPESRIFGIGMGTFIMLVLFLFIAFTWFITRPVLYNSLKWGARIASILIFGVTLLLLVYAQRKEQYVGQGNEVKIYDTSYAARTGVFIIMVVSTVIALITLFFTHFTPSFKRSNVEMGYTALWQR